MVVLPLPEGPTRAHIEPLGTVIEIPRSTGTSAWYPKSTSTSSTLPPEGASGEVSGSGSTGESMT